jgi:hypothetical protein
VTTRDEAVSTLARRRTGLIAGLASIVCGVAAAAIFLRQGAAIPVALAILGIGCSVYSWRQGTRVLAAMGATACVATLALVGVIAWGFWSAGELTF